LTIPEVGFLNGQLFCPNCKMYTDAEISGFDMNITRCRNCGGFIAFRIRNIDFDIFEVKLRKMG